MIPGPALDAPIRILCVDDHAVVREGIALIVGSQDDMTVVASAASGEEGVDLFRRHRPDVTLMDLRMPGMDGLDAIRSIRDADPQARVIVLTMRDEEEVMFRAMQAGAASYLLKDTLSKELIQVIREVHAGRSPVSDEVAARLAGRIDGRVLTARETEIVELMGQGLTNKAISASLGIATETVHAHVKHIFVKLDVGNRASAVAAAVRRGIIHLK
ncbi:MAG: response regulator transcription factor [Acidobacteria bacterium]|nr:response regulator transcription factor [Acidobacteriota bacterium]